MYFVSGNTLKHKNRIRDLGGFWDNSYKVWRFRSLNDFTRQELEKLDGIEIEKFEQKPSAISRRNLQFDNFKPTKPKRPEIKTKMFGNDQTYFNYFNKKDPVCFFGFDSVAELIKYIKEIPNSVKSDSDRNSPWDYGEDFTGTKSMSHALDLCENGWSEGVEKAEKITENLSTEFAQGRKQIKSLTGGRVNVGAMLSGNPVHMKKKAKAKKRKVVTIFASVGMIAKITTKNAILRACAVCAVADILEKNGYSCEIVATNANTNGAITVIQTATILKSAGEKLNLNDVVFAMGHPSFERRFHFALTVSTMHAKSIWSSQGGMQHAFKKTKDNEIYISHLTPEMQNEIPKGSDEQKVKKILEMIVPNGLIDFT